MRRFCSILALIVVLCPIASPLWASASVAGAMSCHRKPLHRAGATPAKTAHHCHAMANMAASDNESEPTLNTSGSSQKCPMNCCVQATPTTVAALPAASLFPPLHVIETSFHGLAVTFSNVGFSSHTDRGPPSL